MFLFYCIYYTDIWQPIISFLDLTVSIVIYRLLKILLSYFVFLAAIAALQVTLLANNKLNICYNPVIRVLYVVIINVTGDLDVVVAT